MDISMESFHGERGKTGALVRRRGPREVRALAVMAEESGIYHVEAALTHPGDVLAWTRYTLTSADGETTLVRDGDTITTNGTTLPAPSDALPSHVAPVLLDDMLAGSATEAEFHRIDEGHLDAAPARAHYSVGNPETVTLPDGRTLKLGVAELLVDEKPLQRFWFDSFHVVATDWGGARSYRVESVDDLVGGLDPEVADVVRHFCG